MWRSWLNTCMPAVWCVARAPPCAVRLTGLVTWDNSVLVTPASFAPRKSYFSPAQGFTPPQLPASGAGQVLAQSAAQSLSARQHLVLSQVHIPSLLHGHCVSAHAAPHFAAQDDPAALQGDCAQDWADAVVAQQQPAVVEPLCIPQGLCIDLPQTGWETSVAWPGLFT